MSKKKEVMIVHTKEFESLNEKKVKNVKKLVASIVLTLASMVATLLIAFLTSLAQGG